MGFLNHIPARGEGRAHVLRADGHVPGLFLAAPIHKAGLLLLLLRLLAGVARKWIPHI
jgi:prepilin-type processing-associated H-X9-DG protein